jgi:DNA-binding MarR family transcriptional regulator/GNAT superfamily N-acetyltransferase
VATTLPQGSTGDDAIAAVRRYNRFYTQQLGLLNERLPGSAWSLAEARLLYELAHKRSPAASELARELLLDPGYVSRILRRFEAAGLIERRRDAGDGRRSHLWLTAAGRQAFATLDGETRAQIARLLAPLEPPARTALVASMSTIHQLLSNPVAGAVAPRSELRGAGEVRLRDPAPGDVGWVVQRHGTLYAQEFGYDATFEGLVAKIAGAFLEKNDPAHERCWIAERDGVRVGSVFLLRLDSATAKLRLLFVEPSARGAGVGAMLVHACTRFAREAGYSRITLWTQSHLAAARKLYVNEGYRRVAEEPHHSFGLDLVAETWTLEL